MRIKSSTATLAAAVVLAFGSLSSVWLVDQADAKNRRHYRSSAYRSTATIPAGTPISVRLDSKISTEDVQAGDAWSGTVTQAVVASDGRLLIPAGAAVSGVVTSAAHGTHSSRPQLGLGVRRVTINGQSRAFYADTEPIVAETKRAKKIGAIAGGAAAGALLGGAVSKSKRGALIGGLLGGAATYGLTRNAFRTLQLKPGTVVTFTTRENVAVRV